jgi:omega-6 fatty acid desaturase (delta-12 desaturase)
MERNMTLAELQRAVRDYTRPRTSSSLIQLANTLLPYLALWALVVLAVRFALPWWTVAALVPLLALLLVRLFILFHDCCHQSFFPSRTANRLVGFVLGVLTFTPYERWADEHLTHHGTVANLDQRGTGDIWTMTVAEYRAAPWSRRLAYRLVRHPFVLFGLGPIWVFMVDHRLPKPGAGWRSNLSTLATDLGLLGMFWGLSLLIGWPAALAVQLSVMYMAGAAGIWLFYIQHQFDPTHWSRQEEWSFLDASLQGSSWYKLPKVLQWITGNIGLHHVHHVNARIPNYNLQPCLEAVPCLHQVCPVTLMDSLRTVRMNLWDEDRARLVSFRDLHRGGQ